MATHGKDDAVEGSRSPKRPRTAAEQRAAAPTSKDPEALAADIERTREELAETLDAIADRVSPKRVAKRTTKKVGETVKEGAAAAVETVKDAAGAVREKVSPADQAGPDPVVPHPGPGRPAPGVVSRRTRRRDAGSGPGSRRRRAPAVPALHAAARLEGARLRRRRGGAGRRAAGAEPPPPTPPAPLTPEQPGPGQESVWDYPRPPRLERSDRELVVVLGAVEVCRTRRAWRVLETSHPPGWYLPAEDWLPGALVSADGSSYCEWKGVAAYLDVVGGGRTAPRAAWTYPDPTPAFANLAGAVAVYPAAMDSCTVDGEVVRAQEGGFYGGWVTDDVVGPFKGAPGTLHW